MVQSLSSLLEVDHVISSKRPRFNSLNTLKRRERGGRRPRSRPALNRVEPFHLEAFEKEPDHLVAAVGVFVLVTVGGVDPQGLDMVI